MVAMNITDAARQRALLLHYAGEDTNEIFDTLPNTEAAEDENTLTKAMDALTVHFEDKKNIVFSKNTSLGKRGKKVMKRSKLTIRV